MLNFKNKFYIITYIYLAKTETSFNLWTRTEKVSFPNPTADFMTPKPENYEISEC